MRTLKARHLALAAATLLLPQVGWAGGDTQAAVCKPGSPVQEALSYLRRLSLDLRGRVPSEAEARQVVKEGKVPGALIDKMLRSREFLKQVADYHRDLLWSNVSNLRITNQNWALRTSGRGDKPLWLNANGRASVYRGERVSCADEPARFRADGTIIKHATMPAPRNSKNAGKRIPVEGYVWVEPYWAPGTRVKVCAFDAQENAWGVRRGRRVRCDTAAGTGAAACGCGPKLAWCQGPGRLAQAANTRKAILDAMAQSLLRFTTNVVDKDRPYTDILTAKDMEVNGPIVHFLRYQGPVAYFFARADPKNDFALPALAFKDRDRWVKVTRGPRHAGLLTMPAFLLRFQTNRGRAARFHLAFLCHTFEMPSGGLPPGSDPCNSEPNLMKRCGCKYCHQTLEPDAAYWGRFSPAGMTYLDEKLYPVYDKSCARYSGGIRMYVPQRCRQFYFTKAGAPSEKPYLGYLKPYVFATEAMKKNIQTGPVGIAQRVIKDGSFARCTAKNLWTWFTGKKPSTDQQALLKALGDKFKSGGYSFRALVKSIVTSEAYKRGSLLDRKEG